MLNMSPENQITHEQTPLAYFTNKKGVRFAVYSQEQVEDAEKTGYKRVETETKPTEAIAAVKSTEKVG